MKKYQSFSHGNSLTGGRNGATSSTVAATKNSPNRNNNNRKLGRDDNKLRRSNSNKRKKKGAHEETFTQALLYVFAYFLCYIFVIAAQFMEKVSFPLMLLKAIFYPSQGKEQSKSTYMYLNMHACIHHFLYSYCFPFPL